MGMTKIGKEREEEESKADMGGVIKESVKVVGRKRKGREGGKW